MTTKPIFWLTAWRGHIATGRGHVCGYWTGVNTCSKPNVVGHQVIDCPNCETGTQQARFARLAVKRTDR